MKTEAQTRKEARATVATAGKFWLPTRPYTVIDAVNRMASATGSVRYAQLSANASYNGHNVSVSYNDYRGYSVCEHFFGERVVHARGEMTSALRAGRYEYDRGDRGTSVHTCELTEDEAKYALSLGYIPWTQEGEDAWTALWYTELHGCVGTAMNDAKYRGCDTVHILLQSTDAIDYHEKRERAGAKQLFRGDVKECRMVGPAGERCMVLSGKHMRSGADYATLLINGQTKISGSVDAVRAEYKALRSKGYTAEAAA